MKTSHLVLVAAAASACQTGGDSNAVPSREALLDSLATTVFLPAYVELADEAAAMADAAPALCDAPDEATLVGIQQAWKNTRLPLERAEAFHFGPIADLSIDSAINFWPVRTDTVESVIATGEEPTADWVAAQGSAAKGLPVLEYLWFDPVGGNAAILASFDPATPEGAHRCAVAAALAQDVAARTAELRDAWDPAKGDFAGALSADGDDTPGHPSLLMAIADVVNAAISGLQDITDQKMGRPLGEKTGGVPQPDDTPSRFSDHDRVELSASLAGFELVYLGSPGAEALGLTDVIAPLDAPLDAAIREQLEAAKTAAAAMPLPLRTAVVDDPAPAQAARDEVRELRRLIEVDVAGLLGINVSLNDNDGD